MEETIMEWIYWLIFIGGDQFLQTALKTVVFSIAIPLGVAILVFEFKFKREAIVTPESFLG